MCTPSAFTVIDVKNDFMRGNIDRVERRVAERQWRELVELYEQLRVDVHLLDPEPRLEDMVFTANTATVLPQATGDDVTVVMSRMNHPSRQKEVPPTRRWFERAGFVPLELPDDCGTLEGHGDVLVVPERRFAFAGFGGRTTRRAIDALRELAGIPVIPLPLVGAPFYHLDTCLAVLDANTVLVHGPAFEPGALATLAEHMPRLLVADPGEARQAFACNVHALESGDVVMPAQATKTAAQLTRAGFTPRPVDVSQFHLSGGSVFCMRLDIPAVPRAREH